MRLENNQLIQGLVELKWMTKEAVPLLSTRMYEDETSVVGKLRAHGLTAEAVFEAAIFANDKLAVKMPVVDLKMIPPMTDFDASTFVTVQEMHADFIVPIMMLGARLVVATADPFNEKCFDKLALISPLKIDYWLADSEEITQKIDLLNQKPVAERFKAKQIDTNTIEKAATNAVKKSTVLSADTTIDPEDSIADKSLETLDTTDYTSGRKEPTLSYMNHLSQSPQSAIRTQTAEVITPEPINAGTPIIAAPSIEKEGEAIIEAAEKAVSMPAVNDAINEDTLLEADARFVDLQDSSLDTDEFETRVEKDKDAQEFYDPEENTIIVDTYDDAISDVSEELDTDKETFPANDIMPEPSASPVTEAILEASEKQMFAEMGQEVLDDVAGEQAQDFSEDISGSIIEYINFILLDAITQKASDIHFEPYESSYRIRFRIDGILHKVYVLPEEYRTTIASRLKVMAELDIAEKRLPQDGHITICIEEAKIDARISVIPTLWGEKIVIRLLDKTEMNLSLAKLGLTPIQKGIIQTAIEKSQGLILVTGPTGSGKTVSLYACLNHLNEPIRNIATVEDPIEINLEGVNQLQIHPKIGLDFAEALRSFLRQDPDVLMVGEIRDFETADITMKAAQTGHLVLSTLHTNNAVDSLVRLKNMGVERYNIASTVKLIVAQRLLRELCHCKEEDIVDSDYLETLGFTPMQAASRFYRASGCSECHDGYRGRFAIFEVMPISKRMESLILEGASAGDIRAQAEREGIKSLRQSGIDAVIEGKTSLEEVLRVTVD